MFKRNINRFINIRKEIGLLNTIKLYLYYSFSRNKKYIDFMVKFLEKENKEIIEKYKSKKASNFKNEELIIWYFWWQGFDNLPEIPKTCYNSLIKNCPKKVKVVFIDKNNYLDYADIPDEIIKKLEEKKFTLTHFSDLLRQALLCQHGGFWIDSTVFCPNKLDYDKIAKKEFWSIKLPNNMISKKSYGQNISQGKYAGFILKNTQKSVLMDFVKECNFSYWKKHDYLIEYFIQILLIKVAYKNIPSAKEEIDSYEESNYNLYELDKKLNMIYDEKVYNDLISNTDFFKLSWKKKYIKEIDGNKTIFGHILEEYNNGGDK